MLGKSEKGKNGKRKQSEIQLLTSTIQFVLDPPLTWTLIAVQKNGRLTAGLLAGLTAVLTGIIVVILGLTAGLTAGLTGIIVVILGVPY